MTKRFTDEELLEMHERMFTPRPRHDPRDLSDEKVAEVTERLFGVAHSGAARIRPISEARKEARPDDPEDVGDVFDRLFGRARR